MPLLAPLLAANIPEFKVLLAASLLELEVQVPIFSIQLVALHLELKPPIWELNVLILGGWRSCLRRLGLVSSEQGRSSLELAAPTRELFRRRTSPGPARKYLSRLHAPACLV